MRNYIEIKGIAKEDVVYTTPKGSKIKVTNAGMGTADVEVVSAAQGCSPAGSKGKIEIDKMPGLQDLIKSNRDKLEAAFVAKYPNMDKLLDIIKGHAAADEEFNRMMESGDSVLKLTRPEITIETARELYPEEAAYMDILAFADANPSSKIGFIRRCAGELAVDLLLSGAAATMALIRAEEEIAQKTDAPKYKSHIAGL